MGEFMFVVKTLVITVAIVFLLQVRVGRTTIEQHSLTWMHQSAAIEALRGVADGAVLAATNGLIWAKDAYQKKFGGGSSSAEHNSSTKHARRKEWEQEATRPHGDDQD